jgi:hypothetical protein
MTIVTFSGAWRIPADEQPWQHRIIIDFIFIMTIVIFSGAMRISSVKLCSRRHIASSATLSSS